MIWYLMFTGIVAHPPFNLRCLSFYLFSPIKYNSIILLYLPNCNRESLHSAIKWCEWICEGLKCCYQLDVIRHGLSWARRQYLSWYRIIWWWWWNEVWTEWEKWIIKYPRQTTVDNGFISFSSTTTVHCRVLTMIRSNQSEWFVAGNIERRETNI